MASTLTKILRNQRCYLTRRIIINRKYNVGEHFNLNPRTKWRQSEEINNSASGKRKFHANTSLNRSFFFTGEKYFKGIQDEAKKCEFPVRYLEFTSCQSLYLQLIAKGEDRPSSGVKFNLAYIDTNPSADKKAPVVVCLHGSPGGHWDFNNLASYLHRKGVRVISINFPGYGWTAMDKERKFTSTSEEKAILVQEFLQNLGIESVDMGIVHSTGIYPALILCSEDLNICKSLLMINPAGLGYHKILRPFWLLKFHARHYKNPILWPFLKPILKTVLVTTRFGNTNTHQMSVALESSTSVPYEKYKDYPRSMSLRGIPRCLIYSLNDAAVGAKLSNDLANLFEVKGKTTYGKDAKVKTSSEKKGDLESWQHVFDRGGHLLMKRYPDLINKISGEFLDQVLKKRRNQ